MVQIGAAGQEDRKGAYRPNNIREWAVVGAILLVVFATLSWPNGLYVTGFLVGAAAFGIFAMAFHFSRPFVETE